MELIIRGTPKEIADLVVQVQGRQDMDLIISALEELGFDQKALRKS